MGNWSKSKIKEEVCSLSNFQLLEETLDAVNYDHFDGASEFRADCLVEELKRRLEDWLNK